MGNATGSPAYVQYEQALSDGGGRLLWLADDPYEPNLLLLGHYDLHGRREGQQVTRRAYKRVATGEGGYRVVYEYGTHYGSGQNIQHWANGRMLILKRQEVKPVQETYAQFELWAVEQYVETAHGGYWPARRACLLRIKHLVQADAEAVENGTHD